MFSVDENDISKGDAKHLSEDEKESVDFVIIVWHFAFDLEREEFQHKNFLQKMIAYSNMTWSDVKKQTHDDGKSKHHFLSIDSLSKETIDRIKFKKLQEYSDSIFSFAFQNKLRIVGIRINECFHVLWYDSEHEICPSKKKNT